MSGFWLCWTEILVLQLQSFECCVIVSHVDLLYMFRVHLNDFLHLDHRALSSCNIFFTSFSLKHKHNNNWTQVIVCMKNPPLKNNFEVLCVYTLAMKVWTSGKNIVVFSYYYLASETFTFYLLFILHFSYFPYKAMNLLC